MVGVFNTPFVSFSAAIVRNRQTQLEQMLGQISTIDPGLGHDPKELVRPRVMQYDWSLIHKPSGKYSGFPGQFAFLLTIAA